MSSTNEALEISCQFMDSVFAISEGLGADARELCRDLPYSFEYLCDSDHWIDWATFALIMRRILDEPAATPQRIVEISAATMERALPRFFLNMVGLIATPEGVARWYFSENGQIHSYCRVFRTRFEAHRDGFGFTWSVELAKPHHELTRVNFWGMKGQAEAGLRLLGARDIKIQMRELARGFEFEARYSQRSLALRLRTLLARPLRARRARAVLSEANSELLDRLRQLEAEVRRRERVEEQLRRQMATAESLEQQLGRSERLNSLGLITGGVAHDFNNLLVAIMGHAGMLRAELGSLAEGVSEDLDGLDQAAERAAELTRQLLTFGRQQATQMAPRELHAEVVRTWKLLARLLPSHIDGRLVCEHEGIVVFADRSQLEQVVMNLVLNARDAMPDGGGLEVRIAVRELGAEELSAAPELAPGPYALIRVSDEGEGIAAEDLERIFDPFFTTKAEGLGTGLGLSVVLGVIRHHGGFVVTSSELGRGTSFEVFLPICTHASIEREALARGPAPGGDEHILLVDDHDLVRSTAAVVLRAAGYTVRVANDGEAALEQLRVHDFALVITDVIMPRRSGVSLAHEVRASRPGLRLLLMTSYTGLSDQLDELLAEDVALLAKPFTLEALRWAVRDALDQPPSDRSRR